MQATKLFLYLAVVLFASSALRRRQDAVGGAGKKNDSGMTVLADAKGMTLYTFDKDMKGMSVCADKCAQNWPPLAATADAKPMGDWTIVDRQDGTKQWAYKGKSLYTFVRI